MWDGFKLFVRIVAFLASVAVVCFYVWVLWTMFAG